MKQVNHIFTNCDVRTAIKGLKSEKSDGSTELTSDSLINELIYCLNIYRMCLPLYYITVMHPSIS